MNKKLIILLLMFVSAGVLAHITVEFYNTPTPINYYNFDGNDYVNILSSNSLNISNAVNGITLSAWIKIDQYECYRRIVAKSHTTGSAPYTIYGLLTDCNSSGALNEGVESVRMEIAGGGRQHFIRSSTSFNAGEWYHITGTYNNSDGAKFYINGILDNSTLFNTTSYSPFSISEVNNITGGQIDTNNNPVSIGSSYFSTTPADFFKGSIDEVRIFNRSLSSSEVSSLYNNGLRNESDLSIGTSNLVAYYPLNSSTPYDYSGNSNDGNRIGATLYESEHIFNSSKNITFSGNENKTYWIYVDKNANFTSATLNLSGIDNGNFNINEEDSYSCDGGADCINTVDENSGTYYRFSDCLSQTGILYTIIENSTIPNTYNYNSFNWTSFGNYEYDVSSIPNRNFNKISYYNYSSDSWVFLGYSNCKQTLDVEDTGVSSCSFIISSDGINSNNQVSIKTEMNSTISSSCSTSFNYAQYNEGFLSLDITNIQNPNVIINETEIWSYSGEFLQNNNKTNDFNSTLNTAINSGSCDCTGCILENERCSIPINFHSDTAGFLEFSDINIEWLEYESPKINITEPSGEYITTEIPYDVNVSDNWEADTCIYWVTRGASTEVSNTTVNCSESINGNLYVSSIFTNYTFHFWANDTSGNYNQSNSSFATTQNAIVITPPSSGGGGVSPEGEDKTGVSNCDIYTEPLSKAIENFKDNTNSDNWWENVKRVWNAFWNKGLCDSAGSIVPII